MLRLSQRTVYKLLAQGRLPGAKVGGQWRYVNKKYKYDLVVTSNETAPNIPVTSKMEPIA